VSGAVDWAACTNRRGQNCHCRPKCRRCGYGPHMAIHGPLYGRPPGSEPYGHEYNPASAPPARGQ